MSRESRQIASHIFPFTHKYRQSGLFIWKCVTSQAQRRFSIVFAWGGKVKSHKLLKKKKRRTVINHVTCSLLCLKIWKIIIFVINVNIYLTKYQPFVTLKAHLIGSIFIGLSTCGHRLMRMDEHKVRLNWELKWNIDSALRIQWRCMDFIEWWYKHHSIIWNGVSTR